MCNFKDQDQKGASSKRSESPSSNQSTTTHFHGLPEEIDRSSNTSSRSSTPTNTVFFSGCIDGAAEVTSREKPVEKPTHHGRLSCG